MHLSGQEFRVQRLRMFHQSSRSRATAEEDQCRQQANELNVLMLASQQGLNWTALEPQLALALARAVRDTLMAEEETAKLRVQECENLLATLKDTMDDAHARVQDAHQQIASITSFFDQEGIRISLFPLSFNAHQDHSHSSNVDSDDSDDSEMNSNSDHESAPDEDI